MSTIKIDNLSFSYDQIEVFRDLCFTLRKDKSLSIIGGSGEGKTTLLKILNGDLKYNGNVLINGKEVSCNSNNIYSVVFKDTPFINKVVKDELRYALENLEFSKNEIDSKINILNDYFSIKKILNKDISSLSRNDKILVKILSYAITNPCYLALDDLLVYLNNRTKILLLNYLNSNNVILINVTSDLEDVIYTDYILCLYKGISAIDGKTMDVLANEKLLKRLGFSLPFMYDLSMQLKLYGLVKKVYFNKELLVKNLWK